VANLRISRCVTTNREEDLPNLDYVVPIWVPVKGKSNPFPYPKTTAPGSPDAPHGRAAGETILRPILDLDYGYLQQVCIYAAYNYHFHEWQAFIEGKRRRTITGWGPAQLKAYCQAVPLSTQVPSD
jgi:hypothetical protein